MQSIVWNPWHGCHKISEGCRHCYVYREDAARGVAEAAREVRQTASFGLPVKRDRRGNWKYPSGTEFALCFTSDLLIEEADGWRPEIWDMIRRRRDCTFYFFTKRIERLALCLPDDWGDGWPHVAVGCTVENQERADRRMPVFLSAPLAHRIVVVAPMLGPVDLRSYLDPRLIETVTVGGESGRYARPLHFDWVVALREQCRDARVPFNFHQTGSYLVKDGRQYHIPRQHQHSQARKSALSWP